MELQILNRILFTDLRPENTAHWSQGQFISAWNETQTQPLFFPAKWEHNHEKPLTAAEKFYARNIESDCNRFYNHVANELQLASSREEKEYLANQILRRTLSRLLYDISEVISRTAATEPDTIYNTPENYQKPNPHFVLEYLKAAAVTLYMNVQQQYSEFINDDLLTEAELRRLCFNEKSSNSSLMRERKKTAQPQQPVGSISATDNTVQLANDDSYQILKKLLVKESTFNQTLNRLKEYEIIDQDLAFIYNKEKNHARKLAVVCKLLTEHRGLFRLSHPGLGKKTFKQADLLRLLYKLFKHPKLRDTGKKITHEMIEEVRTQLPWLDQLFPV